jgi:hypothetical protein
MSDGQINPLHWRKYLLVPFILGKYILTCRGSGTTAVNMSNISQAGSAGAVDVVLVVFYTQVAPRGRFLQIVIVVKSQYVLKMTSFRKDVIFTTRLMQWGSDIKINFGGRRKLNSADGCRWYPFFSLGY